jgi:hypothetical protein
VEHNDDYLAKGQPDPGKGEIAPQMVPMVRLRLTFLNRDFQ